MTLAKLWARGAIVRYPYGDKALREPVVRTWAGSGGTPFAVVTMNSYGCDVLNTANIMFVDVDIEDIKTRAGHEVRALKKLDAVLDANGKSGSHVYQTAGGLRYILVLDAPVAPRDPRATELMQALGADPHYVKLCRVQQSYRARLTPKPWRVGTQALKVPFPPDSHTHEHRIRHWQQDYRRKCEGHAVCHYLGRVGHTVRCSPEVGELIAFHDAATGSGSCLPLA